MKKELFASVLAIASFLYVTPLTAQSLTSATTDTTKPPATFTNPVLPGFHPDPSICRVGDDYYLVTSSFVWYPGIPIHHSKDLINWKIIGHGITRPGLLNLNGIKDKNGIWAVTIRYHDGLFYLIGNCNECGGNFYITATDPTGPWSDPVWLKDAPGIDPSLFWDENGKCYYTGNRWDLKKDWSGQVAVWGQEINLATHAFVGERKILTYGHAANAGYAESPHLYTINGKPLLLIAEGGSDYNHAVTTHYSDSILGRYQPHKVNPALTHRHLGLTYPVQAIGHGDLVETQNGEWWAVVLGKRLINGAFPLSRETFLCKVEFENGTPIFNAGEGRVLQKQKRPALPWTPVPAVPTRDEFEQTPLSLQWYTVRIPLKQLYSINKGQLALNLQTTSVDSLVCAAMLIQKIKHTAFEAATQLSFTAQNNNEEAGIIIHRNNESYYTLMKTRQGITLTRKSNGKKEIIASANYTKPHVCFTITAGAEGAQFCYGETLTNMQPIGKPQTLAVIGENSINKFNGAGIGMYASSNGQASSNKAVYEWFEYKQADAGK